MKVLLDENLDHRLRKLLVAHDVYTVDYMDWAGLKQALFKSHERTSAAEAALTLQGLLSRLKP